MTIYLLKSLLLLGTFALLAPGVAARYLGPGSVGAWGRHVLGWGAGLAVSASLASVAVTLVALGGGLDFLLALEYLAYSRAGRLTLLRLAFVGLLLALGLRRGPSALYLLAALGLLATLSLSAHAGASGALWPLTADLGHLAAAALWLGAVAGLAGLPPGADAALVVPRVSRAGLVGVLVLLGSGVYSASLRVLGVASLGESLWGRALIVKLALVALILLIAALNRWWLVPAFERRGSFEPLRRFVRLELLLLAAVLVASGVLSSAEPPSLN